MLTKSVFAAIAALLFLVACDESSDQQAVTPSTPSTAATPPAAPEEPIPLGQLSKSVMPTKYRLALTIVPEKDRFEGEDEIDVTLAEARQVIYLHGRDLRVSTAEAVLHDGRHVKASYEEVDKTGVARLKFPEILPIGAVTLHFVYDAAFGTQLSGLYKVTDNGEPYIFSQFEATSARRAFPSFDEPAFKVPFALQVTARDADKVVTSTAEIRAEPLGNGLTRHTFQSTKPLPSYLLAFAVGALDIVEAAPIPSSAVRETPIPLRGVTVKGKGDRIRYALAHTADIVLILEDYFGVAYPYEKLDLVAAADFGANGMENAATIVFRETAILLDDSATLSQKRAFAYIQAHELSHQWFGDLVTPAWWDDVWLNESFASWMGEKATAIWLPEGEYDRDTIRDAQTVMDLDSLPSARSLQQPIKTNEDIYGAFDAITYDKGAGVLAMFESYLGKEAFREGVRLHMKRFSYGVATTRDFLESLAQGSSRPEVTAAFETFLTQPGVPLISLKVACSSDPTEDVSQAAYAPLGATAPSRLWFVPVCTRAATSGSASQCDLLDEARRSFPIEATCTVPTFPNANGAGYYRFTLDPEAWRALTADMSGLTPAERIALVHSLRAGFQAGTVETKLYLETLTKLANDETWDVVEASLNFLTELHDTLLTPEGRAAFDARMKALLMPRYTALGLSAKPYESVGNMLTRVKAIDFLVRTVGAAEVVDQLTANGEAFIASGGAAPTDMAPDLTETAMWAAGKKNGAATGREMVAALAKSNDQQFRRSIVVALQGVDDPSFNSERNTLLLSDSMRTNEATRLLDNLLDNPDRRADTWSWIKSNFDAYGKRLSDAGRARIASRMKRACDPGLRSDIASFFEPKLSTIPGAARALSNALDAIDRCIALNKARGAEVNAWFKAETIPGSN